MIDDALNLISETKNREVYPWENAPKIINTNIPFKDDFRKQTEYRYPIKRLSLNIFEAETHKFAGKRFEFKKYWIQKIVFFLSFFKVSKIQC